MALLNLNCINYFKKSNYAVVVPIYRESLTKDEEISLRQLLKIINEDQIIVICPEGQTIPNIASNLKQKRFDSKFFKSINGYNSLMVSSIFYSSFIDFKYILIYQLDCLVFRDEIKKWIKKDFSYVAPPWFAKFWNDPTLGLWKVGNGGFSMRKISSAIKVLRMKVPRGTMKVAGERAANSYIDSLNPSNHYRPKTKTFDRDNREFVTVEEDVGEYPLNEDLFWSFEAPILDQAFKIPNPKEALSFGFEKCPHWCYSENGDMLPMGCHAWAKEGREFWTRFLSKEVLN